MVTNTLSLYHVIQVRMSALVVMRVGHARRISSVLIKTGINAWGVALMKQDATQRVRSLCVSPSTPSSRHVVQIAL